MFRIALIGAGDHSRRAHATPLARYAREHPGVIELSAVCDRVVGRAEDFRREFGFLKSYDDITPMLAAERLDACLCIVPVPLAVPISSQMLTRGLPCVIEKPLGTTVEEGQHLVDVAMATGTHHMVSMNRRFMPHLNELIALARAAGPIRFARAAMFRHARREPEFVDGTAIHAIDALRHIAGEIVDIDAHGIAASELTSQWGTATLRFDSGCIARLDVLPTASIEEESYEFCGEGYRALISWQKPQDLRMRFWQQGKLIVDRAAGPDDAEDVIRGDYDEVKALIGSLRGERPWWPSVNDVLPSMKAAAEIASRFRQSVD